MANREPSSMRLSFCDVAFRETNSDTATLYSIARARFRSKTLDSRPLLVVSRRVVLILLWLTLFGLGADSGPNGKPRPIAQNLLLTEGYSDCAKTTWLLKYLSIDESENMTLCNRTPFILSKEKALRHHVYTTTAIILPCKKTILLSIAKQ
jgi:hypothetical protein